MLCCRKQSYLFRGKTQTSLCRVGESKISSIDRTHRYCPKTFDTSSSARRERFSNQTFIKIKKGTKATHTFEKEAQHKKLHITPRLILCRAIKNNKDALMIPTRTTTGATRNRRLYQHQSQHSLQLVIPMGLSTTTTETKQSSKSKVIGGIC